MSESNGVIPLEVWAAWVERACRVNEYAAPDRGRHAPAGAPGPVSDDAPGTDFNRRGTWAETGLLDAGWAWVPRSGGEDSGLLCRPGKEHGVSASAGLISSRENGWPLFWCWSTSVPEFVAEQPYNRFAVFATLRHQGDFAAAARELAERGYGRRASSAHAVIPPQQQGEADATPERLFLWMSELKAQPENDKWCWNGYLSRGGVTLISALFKSGKSTLLSHLIRAFDGRDGEFLGREIVASRVLYVTEEHQELWAERRDAMGIGDHVGMICRPFRGRPSPADWSALIGKIVVAVTEYRFDVVIFDTLSKLWPVREENDAGQVEDALMPLWSITNLGAALLLVHHDRKSGGDDFTGMRGSGGLPAFCETLVSFGKFTQEGDRTQKRILQGKGRYKETPDKLLIELRPSGYVALGDPDDPTVRATLGSQAVIGRAAPAQTWQSVVGELIPDTIPGSTVDEIHTALTDRLGYSVRNADIIALLNGRFDDGEYHRVGKGVKGSPFRFYRVTDSSGPDTVPPLGDEEGTDSEEPNADTIPIRFPDSLPTPDTGGGTVSGGTESPDEGD